MARGKLEVSYGILHKCFVFLVEGLLALISVSILAP